MLSDVHSCLVLCGYGVLVMVLRGVKACIVYRFISFAFHSMDECSA